MSTHPIPQNKTSHRARGFTLIELLVVIAIIALLVSITIPIYRLVNDGTNSARSLANLKSIGSGISVYAAENNNYLPVVESEETLDWTNIEIDIEDEDLEKLPAWVRTLIHFAAENDSDMSRRVFNCPGLRWKDSEGKKMPAEDILLAYGATDAMNGFDEDDELTPLEPRHLATIENKPNTILVVETKQDGSDPQSYGQVTWREANRDFGRPKHTEANVIDFRFKKAMNALMADGSARGFRHKDNGA